MMRQNVNVLGRCDIERVERWATGVWVEEGEAGRILGPRLNRSLGDILNSE